jgi:hypothetical protein
VAVDAEANKEQGRPLFGETAKHAQKGFDRADIVRDVRLAFIGTYLEWGNLLRPNLERCLIPGVPSQQEWGH